MIKKFDTLLKSRELTLKIISNLSIEQVNKIPEGFKNNIAWNVAHLVVTQQLLCYKFSGLECKVSEDLIENYKKGSVPGAKVSEKEFDDIKQLLIQLPVQLDLDYKNEIFKTYNSYTTSVNVTLNSIEDAIDFNLLHEGIHLGIILQLAKFV